MPSTSRSGPDRSQESQKLSGFPTKVTETQDLGPSAPACWGTWAGSQATAQGLELKLAPSNWIWVPQTAAQPLAPLYPPWENSQGCQAGISKEKKKEQSKSTNHIPTVSQITVPTQCHCRTPYHSLSSNSKRNQNKKWLVVNVLPLTYTIVNFVFYLDFLLE